MLGLHPIEPLGPLRSLHGPPECRPGFLRQGREIGRVPSRHLFGSRARFEPLERIGPDGLEQSEARRARVSCLPAEKALVGKRSERLQRCSADGCGRSEREAPGKDAESGKEVPLGGIEQVVAPVDRRAQRLVAIRQITRPTRQEVEALLEALEQPGG